MKFLMRWINLYPPYLGAGIRAKVMNPDCTHYRVRMKLSWYNGNLISTHFGGSLYSMCDPFFVFIILSNLGTDYIVWDKSASIDFVKPGKGEVYADFRIDKIALAAIQEQVDTEGKGIFEFETTVCHSTDDSLVAKVRKKVYVRKK